MNYVIPEHHLPLIDNHSNKGALLTANLLFDYITSYANGCTTASFHADNCVSQNKNNLIMQLMTYFLITSKLKEISINFMIPGHTKFMPDGFFGLVKKYIRKYRCDSWKQVPQLIESSSINGKKDKAKVFGEEMSCSIAILKHTFLDGIKIFLTSQSVSIFNFHQHPQVLFLSDNVHIVLMYKLIFSLKMERNTFFTSVLGVGAKSRDPIYSTMITQEKKASVRKSSHGWSWTGTNYLL